MDKGFLRTATIFQLIMEVVKVVEIGIKRPEVYHVALIKPRGISMVVTHWTADVQVTSDRPVTLGLVPVELSTSIYCSHAATYIVNT